MLGALIGSIAGSIYEWKNIKTKDFPLFRYDSRIAGDAVMTAAVANAVLLTDDLEDLEGFKANVAAELRRMGEAYLGLPYGPRFEKWLLSDDPRPYDSVGNGGAARVSPVAWAAESLPQCLALAKAATEVTHASSEAVAGACCAAGAVYLARTGKDKDAIRDHVTRYFPLDFTLEQIRPDYAFDLSCAGSVPQAMEAFLEAEDFEDAIRNAISIGGDSDTIACMTGAVAAAFYGIPKDIRDVAVPYLTGEVWIALDRFSRVY